MANPEGWSRRAVESLSWLQGATLNALGVDPEAWASPRSREAPEWIDRIVALEASIAGAEDAKEYGDAYLARVENARPPTAFEAPSWFLVVQDYCERIEQAARELNVTVPHRPLFGSLPCGDMNARAIKVRGADQYLALFHVGLFNFLHALTKVVVQALPSHENSQGEPILSFEPNEIANECIDNPEIAIRFGELLNAYVIEGDTYFAPKFLLDEARMSLAATLRTSSELFVVGHEYGHVIDGHLGRGRTVVKAVGGGKVNEVHNRQEDEFEADRRGLMLSIQAMRRYGWFLPRATFGASFFLKSAELIGKVSATLETGSSEVKHSVRDSHPAPDVRIAALLDAVISDFPRSGLKDDQVEASKQWMLVPVIILEMLFKQLSPFWLEMHEQGVRPNPRGLIGC